MVRHIRRDWRIKPLEPLGLDDVALGELADTHERHWAAKDMLPRHPLLDTNHHRRRELDDGQIATIDARALVLAHQVLFEVARAGVTQSGTPSDVTTRNVPARPVVRLAPFREGAELEKEFPVLHHRDLRR